MHLQQLTENVFSELTSVIVQVKPGVYGQPSKHLSGATIGQHVRHIIELFQCLLDGYESGVVKYEERKRDHLIETDPGLAISMLNAIISELFQNDKQIILDTSFGVKEGAMQISSNYYRELAYNLEHTIHHMALIRVGVQDLTDMVLPETFGMAPSTIQHKKLCAQ